MWKIELIDGKLGEQPGKVRQTIMSKSPDRDLLVKSDQFAIMTRIVPPPFKTDHVCGACKRKKEVAEFIQKQRNLRLTYGPNVSAFPSFARS